MKQARELMLVSAAMTVAALAGFLLGMLLGR